MIRSSKLRASARGETCTVQVPGVCNEDPLTTVLAHLPDESHGMSLKSHDVSACFACSNCHDWLDRRRFQKVFPGDRDFFMRRAMLRTWARWIELGLIRVAA